MAEVFRNAMSHILRRGAAIGKFRQLRRKLPEGLADGVEAPDENAAVPFEVPGVEQPLGFGAFRFLPETQGVAKPRHQGVTALNVTVTGRREARRDAERDQNIASGRLRGGAAQNQPQRLHRPDRMIGGQYHHHGFRSRMTAPDQARSQCDAGRGVAALGFADDVVRRNCPQQFPRPFEIADVGDDQNAFRRHQSVEPGDGFFQQRPVAVEFQELFRNVAAAQRPETFAAPPGHDHGTGVRTVHGVLLRFRLAMFEKYAQRLVPVRHRRQSEQPQVHFFQT
ncbi:hypothetical protein SDC9_81610 [bioreactor metagenome]|uniref:Uncharacterized protein n=1 Tax=bioreactor metagenome TaxID=1076179 RepID=A0A644Z2C8_9ZZZZ